MTEADNPEGSEWIVPGKWSPTRKPHVPSTLIQSVDSDGPTATSTNQIDTGYVRTYTVLVNITLSIDEQIAARAREKLRAVGKSLNQEIRDHLRHVAGDDDNLERDIEFFLKTSGMGKPDAGWKWNRDDIYQDRLKWPRK